MDDPLVTEDARALIADLTVRRQSVATAESLTAGLLAATLAGVAGASVVLRGGLVRPQVWRGGLGVEFVQTCLFTWGVKDAPVG